MHVDFLLMKFVNVLKSYSINQEMLVQVIKLRASIFTYKKRDKTSEMKFCLFVEILLIISQQQIFLLQHPSLLHSRMQKCSQDDGFGSLSSKHAPKRLNLR